MKNMKNIKKALLIILLGACFTACNKPVVKNTSALDAITALGEKAGFDTSSIQNLSDINVAETCGINPDDIEEGYIISSSEGSSPDKLILTKGRNVTSTENIEKALSNLLINLGNTYKGYPEESRKIEEHLFKTRDKMTLLAVCDNAEELEDVFNSFS